MIHRYSRGWADGSIYDEPVPGAVDAIRGLMAQGVAVCVHTTRDPEQIRPWLESHGLVITTDERCGACRGHGLIHPDPASPVKLCENCRGGGEIIFWNDTDQVLVTNRKLPAVAYIDDRGIRFRDWSQALADLAALEQIAVA